MMRSVLLLCVVICLAISGWGVRLVLQQQRRIAVLSATTTATILETRLEYHERDMHHVPSRPRDAHDRYSYEPTVRFRYQAQGRQFTSNDLFPQEFRIGGNLGHVVAKAPLEQFEVGQQATIHYDPSNPSDACLIRRPSLSPYLVVLLPVVAASILIAFTSRSAQPQTIESRRRKARSIAALWHIVGAAAIAHYFSLAGRDYGGVALAVFGIYMQVGLIPLALAMPPANSSPLAKRVKGAIGFSLFGTFIGFWVGLAGGWLGMSFFDVGAGSFLRFWGYSIATGAALFALLGAIVHWEVGRASSQWEQTT